MFALNTFKVGLKFLDWLLLLCGYQSAAFDSIDIAHNSLWLQVYQPKFKEFLSYVYYFIPKTYLAPFFTIMIVFMVLRVSFSLFRLVTDIL